MATAVHKHDGIFVLLGHRNLVLHIRLIDSDMPRSDSIAGKGSIRGVRGAELDGTTSVEVALLLQHQWALIRRGCRHACSHAQQERKGCKVNPGCAHTHENLP